MLGALVLGAGLAAVAIAANPFEQAHNTPGVSPNAPLAGASERSSPAPAPSASATPATATTPPPANSPLTTASALVSPARSAGCDLASEAGQFTVTTDTAEGLRVAVVRIPSAHRPDRPTAMVLNFHGFGRTAEDQDTYSQLPSFAEREGFILVTPEGGGYPQGWDIPGIYNEDGIDDIAFVEALVAQLKATFCIDEDAVYATGISNGAEMASLAACKLPGVFAAIAPVAGIVFPGCEGPGVAVIAFHGTADDNVPFEIAPSSATEWGALNGCTAFGSDLVTDNVVLESWGGGCEGREVFLFVVEGGGHTWPGAEDDSGGVGPTTHEISANELMWTFFQGHRRLRE